MAARNNTSEHLLIVPLSKAKFPDLLAHLKRHFSESGADDFYFTPYDPDDPIGPSGVDFDKVDLPISAPHWQRWFIAIDPQTGNVCGHLDLKADGLRTGSHRCVLGIGMEAQYRGIGLGKILMKTAIDFVRSQASLDWIDLMVFGHNKNAQALYKSFGFSQVGIVHDRFRIGQTKIDDVIMTLKIR